MWCDKLEKQTRDELIKKKMKGEGAKKMMIFVFYCFLIVMEISSANAGGGDQNQNQNQNALPPKMKKLCNYTIRVGTTCSKGAETSNHVSVRFGDMMSNDIVVQHLNTKHMRQVDPLQPADDINDTPKKPFQACSVDEFQVSGDCVETPICYLYLKSRGNDAWRPGFVQVRGLHFSSRNFYFRRNMPAHVWHGSDMCDAQISPFGIKRKRKVFPNK